MILETPDLPTAYTAILTKLRTDQAFKREEQARASDVLRAKAKVVAVGATQGC